MTLRKFEDFLKFFAHSILGSMGTSAQECACQSNNDARSRQADFSVHNAFQNARHSSLQQRIRAPRQWVISLKPTDFHAADR